MFFIQQGAWFFALGCFLLVTIAINGSFVFYDALLPHVASLDEADRLSSTGYGLGYLGGGLVLALGLAMIQLPGLFGFPTGPDLTPAQASLPTRAGFLLGRGVVGGVLDPALSPHPRTSRPLPGRPARPARTPSGRPLPNWAGPSGTSGSTGTPFSFSWRF